MTVKAKYQIAYKGKIYVSGEAFELEDKDLPKYSRDVLVVNKSTFRKPSTKQVVQAETKSSTKPKRGRPKKTK